MLKSTLYTEIPAEYLCKCGRKIFHSRREIFLNFMEDALVDTVDLFRKIPLWRDRNDIKTIVRRNILFIYAKTFFLQKYHMLQIICIIYLSIKLMNH